MQLMTKALEKRFAEVGSQENDSNPIVIAKYFNPAGIGTWYATEYNADTNTIYGYAVLYGDHNDEWGYTSLDELAEYKGQWGMGIERDLYCGEQRISEFFISSLKK